jgi:hypothetical protein
MRQRDCVARELPRSLKAQSGHYIIQLCEKSGIRQTDSAFVSPDNMPIGGIRSLPIMAVTVLAFCSTSILTDGGHFSTAHALLRQIGKHLHLAHPYSSPIPPPALLSQCRKLGLSRIRSGPKNTDRMILTLARQSIGFGIPKARCLW